MQSPLPASRAGRAGGQVREAVGTDVSAAGRDQGGHTKAMEALGKHGQGMLIPVLGQPAEHGTCKRRSRHCPHAANRPGCYPGHPPQPIQLALLTKHGANCDAGLHVGHHMDAACRAGGRGRHGTWETVGRHAACNLNDVSKECVQKRAPGSDAGCGMMPPTQRVPAWHDVAQRSRPRHRTIASTAPAGHSPRFTYT